jgi:hypothetical protein
VIALVPLALRGGPLWEPMCYAQMGGMLCATFITLLLVPVIYSIFVLDLKLIKWETSSAPNSEDQQPEAARQLPTPRGMKSLQPSDGQVKDFHVTLSLRNSMRI